MREVYYHSFSPETRAKPLGIVDRLCAQEHIDGRILGGTELLLLLRDEHHTGIPLLNTAAIHFEQAVKEMMR